MDRQKSRKLPEVVERIVEDVQSMLDQVREDRETACIAVLSLATGFYIGMQFFIATHR
jgi:hypothetical protein